MGEREPMVGPLQLEIYPIDRMVNNMIIHPRLDFIFSLYGAI